MSDRFDVVVVGSGFAGSLVAWGLARTGRRVALVERGRHPRVALGESSTPLANLALERLAVRLGSADLWNLATYGRWQRQQEHLRCGLKRGFSFYRHLPGQTYAPGAGNQARLVVAASPDDEVADVQWWRADVDAAMVRWARAAGVRYLDRTELEQLEAFTSPAPGFLVRGRRAGTAGNEAVALRGDFLVDASGTGGFLAKQLGLRCGAREAEFRTRLVGGHFAGVQPWEELLPQHGSDAPYVESWGAVHHLLDRGWMYQLRFAGDRLSAGFVLRNAASGRSATRTVAGKEEFTAQLSRFPSLQQQFSQARFEAEPLVSEQLPFRLESASGDGWLLLPQTFAFFDPLYSTGIAWSLLAVERILDLFAEDRPARSALRRYGELLAREASHLERLVDVSYRAMEIDAAEHGSPQRAPGGPASGGRVRDQAGVGLDAFALTARLYFVAASYSESAQRLLDEPPQSTAPWWWHGLLGATDPVMRHAVASWGQHLDAARTTGSCSELAPALCSLLRERDVAGLLEDPQARLVPVDLPALVRASARLGLHGEEMQRRLPLLRSPEWSSLGA